MKTAEQKTYEEIRVTAKNMTNRQIKDALWDSGMIDRRAELLNELGREPGTNHLKPAPASPATAPVKINAPAEELSTDESYDGDETYHVPCTGDVCTGDKIRFERATFTGSFRSPKFAGMELVTGEVVADSYGRKKQQHTFTILLAAGGKMKIKGRNVYKNGTWRKLWADESAREAAIDDKHNRGNKARSQRAERLNNREW